MITYTLGRLGHPYSAPQLPGKTPEEAAIDHMASTMTRRGAKLGLRGVAKEVMKRGLWIYTDYHKEKGYRVEDERIAEIFEAA